MKSLAALSLLTGLTPFDVWTPRHHHDEAAAESPASPLPSLRHPALALALPLALALALAGMTAALPDPAAKLPERGSPADFGAGR